MRLGFTYNVRHIDVPDINNPQYVKEAEFDTKDTIDGIVAALRELGHEVTLVEADEDCYEKFRTLRGKIDLVFNIAEGINGADREAHIPAILEMLGIPYTGPKPLGYALGLDKAKAKEVFQANQVATPQWLLVDTLSEVKNSNLKFPVIAKPVGEGSSKGICAKNLVENHEALIKLTNDLLNEFKQPVLIEEYLPGREFTVALLGSEPEVLPLVEVKFDDLPEGMPKFDHYEAKWVYDNPDRPSPLVCPAEAGTELGKKIQDVCLRAFQALGMKDWARIDVRLDAEGEPSVIEINCPPGIIPDPKQNSRFPMAARAHGFTYPQMLEAILISACKRYNIPYKK